MGDVGRTRRKCSFVRPVLTPSPLFIPISQKSKLKTMNSPSPEADSASRCSLSESGLTGGHRALSVNPLENSRGIGGRQHGDNLSSICHSSPASTGHSSRPLSPVSCQAGEQFQYSLLHLCNSPVLQPLKWHGPHFLYSLWILPAHPSSLEQSRPLPQLHGVIQIVSL